MKPLDPWVDSRIQFVRVADIRSYLIRNGWTLKPYPRPELLVFEGPRADNGEPIIQVLPSSEQIDDYLQRLIELTSALAVIENRSASEVLTDLLTSNHVNGSEDPKGRKSQMA